MLHARVNPQEPPKAGELSNWWGVFFRWTTVKEVCMLLDGGMTARNRGLMGIKMKFASDERNHILVLAIERFVG